MIRHFINTFSFEDESTTTDNALQVVKEKILVESIESEWGEQMEHALVCYNLATDGGDDESDEEDLRHLDIAETEGEREVQGPDLKIPDVTKPLKIKKVNIGSEERPKFANVGYYWDDETVSKIKKLLHEYQELFPTKFS